MQLSDYMAQVERLRNSDTKLVVTVTVISQNYEDSHTSFQSLSLVDAQTKMREIKKVLNCEDLTDFEES